MARKKKVEEVVVAAEPLVIEEVQEEAPPAVHVVTLKGSIGSQFHGSVNGVNFVYPCGIELEVPDHIYHAIKAHLV